MIHQNTADAVRDLERAGDLLRISQPVDPYLELPEIQRRLYQAKAPAVLFEQVQGSWMPALANLYGTVERTRYLFRHSLEVTQALVRAKGDPQSLLRNPRLWPSLPKAAYTALPRRVRNGPVLQRSCQLGDLPQIHSWPKDGGAFITLPQVLSLDPDQPSILHSNLGMYRVQISGNGYEPQRECGLHYQIHRGIGVHHARALANGEPLKVSIFVGGPPAHAFAAVMPLPEGIPEVAFAGLLAGTPFRYIMRNGWVISADADVCILGEIAAETKPEGPFGDHLGYYSLAHEFPYVRVRQVLCRRDAIWTFTSVGRPPQEDTTFGDLIHEITADALPRTIPGVREIHAVDAAGVHPLCLAVGSERYVPYAPREPQELLTQSHALLGFGQVSLAKYLWIAAGEDDPLLRAHDISSYLQHVLCRVHFARDLHFHTRTTIDTLDYSGESLNHGSKLVIAAAGEPIRSLGYSADDFAQLKLPACWGNPRVVLPGVWVLCSPPWTSQAQAEAQREELAQALKSWEKRESWPLLTLVDDASFAAANLGNWLWVAFTRSNPSHDVHGVDASTQWKHWACSAPLILDARSKAHHAPALEQDPQVLRRVDSWFSAQGPFAAWG